MFRLVLSILLVVSFSGASAASVMHGLNHESDHPGHHAEMAGDNPLADAEKALADCCDAPGGMGSVSCFGDLVATPGVLPIVQRGTLNVGLAALASSDFSGLTLAVPTGPPKA